MRIDQAIINNELVELNPLTIQYFGSQLKVEDIAVGNGDGKSYVSIIMRLLENWFIGYGSGHKYQEYILRLVNESVIESSDTARQAEAKYVWRGVRILNKVINDLIQDGEYIEFEQTVLKTANEILTHYAKLEYIKQSIRELEKQLDDTHNSTQFKDDFEPMFEQFKQKL